VSGHLVSSLHVNPDGHTMYFPWFLVAFHSQGWQEAPEPLPTRPFPEFLLNHLAPQYCRAPARQLSDALGVIYYHSYIHAYKHVSKNATKTDFKGQCVTTGRKFVNACPTQVWQCSSWGTLLRFAHLSPPSVHTHWENYSLTWRVTQ
jgi:hypothetical protein